MNNRRTDKPEAKELVGKALAARNNSYSPYSRYAVGAAIRTVTGNIYTGCNVENASYGGAICAERTAAVKAVSAGENLFTAIAIVGAPRDRLGEPQLFAIGADDVETASDEHGAATATQTAVITATGDSDYAFPCGICRQFLNEFGPDMTVYVARDEDDILEYSLAELLPHAFGPDNL